MPPLIEPIVNMIGFVAGGLAVALTVIMLTVMVMQQWMKLGRGISSSWGRNSHDMTGWFGE